MSRRIWPWLGGATLCLVAGYAGMRRGEGPSAAPVAPTRPSLKAGRGGAAGGASQVSAPASPAAPVARPVEAVPAPEVAGARSQEDWVKLLAALSGEEYVRQHPGVLEKLAALLVAHPGEEGWEAGAVAYLAHGLDGAAALPFWERAAESLPRNLAISDKLIRTALERLGDPGAPGSSEARAGLEALLARQALRTPQDPQVAWLRAWAAFEDGHVGDAEVLLKAAQGFPAWQEKTGIPEGGALDVREALEGPQSPFLRLSEMMEIQLPAARRMRALASKALQAAQTLQGGGEAERAQDLLASADAMARGYTGGSCTLVGYLTGESMQQSLTQALRDRAAASGNLAGREAADRRLALIAADHQAVMAWISSDQDRDGIEQVIQRLGIGVWGQAPSEQAMANASLLLTDAERSQLNRLARWPQGEVADFLAWRAAQGKK